MLPIAFHSAIALTCAAIVVPETVNAQFIKRFRAVFVPLSTALRTQKEIFAVPALSDEFAAGLHALSLKTKTPSEAQTSN